MLLLNVIQLKSIPLPVHFSANCICLHQSTASWLFCRRNSGTDGLLHLDKHSPIEDRQCWLKCSKSQQSITEYNNGFINLKSNHVNIIVAFDRLLALRSTFWKASYPSRATMQYPPLTVLSLLYVPFHTGWNLLTQWGVCPLFGPSKPPRRGGWIPFCFAFLDRR